MNKGRRKLPGHVRFYRILVIKSAYLIWKLRCGGVIQNENTSFIRQEVLKWIRTMNDRLSLDREATNPKYGRKALSRKMVLRTWSGVLMDKNSLPDDWLGETKILVGIGTGVGFEWNEEGVG